MRLHPFFILIVALDRRRVRASSSSGPGSGPATSSSSANTTSSGSNADRDLAPTDIISPESPPFTDSILLGPELGPSEDTLGSAVSSAVGGDAAALSLAASPDSPTPPPPSLVRQGRALNLLRLPTPILRQIHDLRVKGAAIIDNPRLKNLADRTLPAVALLSLLFGAVRFGGERGIRYLLLALSPGLYHEASSISSVSSSSSAPTGCSSRWAWFLAYSLMLTVPNAVASPPFDGTTATAASTTTLVALVSPERLHWIGYSLSLLGWMTWVIRLNTTGGTRDGKEGEGAATDATANRQHRFLSAWGEVAAHHMSILATLVPLSAWMKLLRSGRMEWALYASLLVICNDTFAYLVGHFAGLRPLLLTISPNKTVEGWAGGFLLTTLASPLIWRRLFEGKPYSFHSLHFALFASVVAPFGGFLASAAKRAYAKKDFGSLLGSHGGLMDRLDCQLITAPYLYLYLATMGEL